jgi:hypothetical protein
MTRNQKKVKIKKHKRQSRSLKTVQPNAAGIDLGSCEHWVAAPPLSDGSPNVQRFGTTTPELLRLADWLSEQKVVTVAMESTGVYWIPLFEILDSRSFEVNLVNARQISHVPGRKTDMIDCQWLQLLHSCGLLRGSFRPDDDICRLRSLIRERNTVVAQRSDWVRRMQKSLDQMNVCVHHAVSDITGVTGMSIIRAIVGGERNSKTLAAFRDPLCRKSEDQIADELTGNWRPEHLFNLAQALKLYDQICSVISDYDSEILKNENGHPTNIRLRWLTAARHIARYYELQLSLKTKLYMTICEEHEEYWRDKIYNLLRHIKDSSFFKCIDPEEMEEEEIDMMSAANVYSFSVWKEGRPDPIDNMSLEEIISNHKLLLTPFKEHRPFLDYVEKKSPGPLKKVRGQGS